MEYIVHVSGVAVSVAQGLINRLEREGYVRVPMKNKRSVDYCTCEQQGRQWILPSVDMYSWTEESVLISEVS